MLQTLEATITQTGYVKFNEPYALDHTVKAYITILPDTPTDQAQPSSGQVLMQLFATEVFANAPAGKPQEIEQQIEQNRNAWND